MTMVAACASVNPAQRAETCVRPLNHEGDHDFRALTEVPTETVICSDFSPLHDEVRCTLVYGHESDHFSENRDRVITWPRRCADHHPLVTTPCELPLGHDANHRADGATWMRRCDAVEPVEQQEVCIRPLGHDGGHASDTQVWQPLPEHYVPYGALVKAADNLLALHEGPTDEFYKEHVLDAWSALSEAVKAAPSNLPMSVKGRIGRCKGCGGWFVGSINDHQPNCRINQAFREEINRNDRQMQRSLGVWPGFCDAPHPRREKETCVRSAGHEGNHESQVSAWADLPVVDGPPGKWVLSLHHREKGWAVWVEGSFEDVMSEVFTFRSGHYGDTYTAMRIEIERLP